MLDSGHISEFVNGSHGDCVETAMAVCTAIVDVTPLTPERLARILASMQSEGIADANGATTIAHAAKWLRDNGYSLLAEIDYQEPFNGDWLQLIRDHAGIHPIILNIANAQSLTDVETNSADEQGVKYHAIAIVGKQFDGYICADGDNPQADSRFQIYNRATLEAGVPCGMIILDMKPVSAPTQPAPAIADDGNTITFPNGVSATQGFAAYYRAHPEIGFAVGAAFPYGNGCSQQVFAALTLNYPGSGDVYGSAQGQDLQNVRDDLYKAHQEIAQMIAKGVLPDSLRAAITAVVASSTTLSQELQKV